MNEFIHKVAKMRELQIRYFKERDPLTLRACKTAEKEVDAMLLQVIQQKKQQPTLFDS